MNLLQDRQYRSVVKSDLYNEQAKKCIECLKKFPLRNMEIDHIYPQSLGGTDCKDDLQLLCSACNKVKGSSSQDVFLRKTEYLRITEINRRSKESKRLEKQERCIQREKDGKTFICFYRRNIIWTLPVTVIVPVMVFLLLLQYGVNRMRLTEFALINLLLCPQIQ